MAAPAHSTKKNSHALAFSVLLIVAFSFGGGSNPAKEDPAGTERKADVPVKSAESGPERKDVPTGSSFPFTDVTKASGMDFVHYSGARGRHYYVETMSPGVALFDADGDGDLDLYLVNGAPLPGAPPGTTPRNRLFRNRGDGTFEDVTELSGTGDTGYGSGCAIGDYDGDGDLDLYVLNYGPNALYRNDGEGRFQRVEVGAEDPTWSNAAAFLDYDLDGDLDLYVVNYLQYDVSKEKHCKAGTLEIYCSPEQLSSRPGSALPERGRSFHGRVEPSGSRAHGAGHGDRGQRSR